MPKTMVPTVLIEMAVQLACRAPSYHNTQPWLWVADDDHVELHLDGDRVAATDHGGRQALISCGAALDHFRVAMAVAGYETVIHYDPNPNDHKHIASVGFTALRNVTTADRGRADAILLRRTDRLPYAAPIDRDPFETAMREQVRNDTSVIDVIDERHRRDLVRASDLSEGLRLYDSAYHAEIDWWTAPYEAADGIPHSALVSAAESDRVDVGRAFPVTRHDERRRELGDDRSTILVISAVHDTRRDIVGCGETLSALLLEATMAGLATGTLSHVTETEATRAIVSGITGRAHPQVLVRVGRIPALGELPPPTPRRPLTDVLHVTSLRGEHRP